jgi:2-polyprenyl-3-methyl-5-hydroxy-6-metoxy-1,4-benzoquinol methylase
MSCRICGCPQVLKAGEVEYYSGYSAAIYDCPDCHCRSTQHYDVVYDALHSNANSCYGLQIEFARKSKEFFDQKDRAGLRRELCSSSKYKFIIESIDHYPKTARILEVGCSRGYLTSYFLLAGYEIVGSDVSVSALDSARADFGPFFFQASSPVIAERSPYDIIYHIGTIGCVSNPVELTRSLLKMLRPGGKLLFNAPNANACWLKGQLWIDFAPPPDVVTLYTPGFWTRFFSDEAYVSEEIEDCPPDYSLVIGLRKSLRSWRRPRRGSIDDSLTRYKYGPVESSGPVDKLWAFVERSALRVISRLGVISLVPGQPAPFGLFVALTKK